MAARPEGAAGTGTAGTARGERPEVGDEGNVCDSDDTGVAHRYYHGNQPSSTLLMDVLTPYRLGQLIALYEHKVFVASVIWDINPFDQWGVELGKQLASSTHAAMTQRQPDLSAFDASTQALLQAVRS